MSEKVAKRKIHEQIIIGSGPAGLTAAIYSARADLSPLVIAGHAFGGQLMQTTDIENFPGFKEGIAGSLLMQTMMEQAQKFGAELVYKNATKVEFQIEITEGKKPVHKVYVEEELYKAHSVIIATGARPRKLNVPGEDNYWGRGVSSCATCDGAFFRDAEVAVVGGGDSAMEEATFLTKFAKKVYVIHRRKELRASKIMQDRAFSNEKIEFIYDTKVTEISGDMTVQKLQLENVLTSEVSSLNVSGLFLAIGYIPETEIFGDFLELTNDGYAKPIPRDGFHTSTGVEGVFVAGDIEDKVYRQAITAAGDGCKASLDAEKWLAEFE